MARILIIEDDDGFRKMLREMLEVAGYEVEEAPDGKVGIKLYQENPADLIITDIYMPEKEGLDVILELNREYPGVKIIAISGGGRGGNLTFLEHAKAFGARLYLVKPFTRQELLGAAKKLLGS